MVINIKSKSYLLLLYILIMYYIFFQLELYAFHAQAKKSGQADKELQGLKEKREQE